MLVGSCGILGVMREGYLFSVNGGVLEGGMKRGQGVLAYNISCAIGSTMVYCFGEFERYL